MYEFKQFQKLKGQVNELTKTLTAEKAKSYYDNFGSKQDKQGFYENKPLKIMLNNANFKDANRIFEFGCGTGKFAKNLFENEISPTCTYVGQDISETMVKLANERLSSWVNRVNIKLSGSLKLKEEDNNFDRFVSTYVLDLLSDAQINEVLREAKRILTNEGKLCLVGISKGCNIRSKVVAFGWKQLFNIKPSLVGGCRPLEILKYIKESDWDIKFNQRVSAKSIASEILIATPNK